MCEAPVRLQDGTLVACRGCQLCRNNRVNDLVGRCIAEQMTSSSTVAVTLTYAGDIPETAALYYPHIQQLLKRLRKAGYKVRYIVAGEYGTRKGRAHWHIVLFFNGASPAITLDRRIEWDFWPHGLCYFQRPDYKGFKYLMKYVLKDDLNHGYSKSLAMSKKPPLGHAFFMKLAEETAERGLPVQSPSYAFSQVLDKNQTPRKFWLQGRMRELYLERYCDAWKHFHPESKFPPWSDFLVGHWDKIAKAEMAADTDRLEADINRKRTKLSDDQIREKLRSQDFLSDAPSQFDKGRKSLGYLLLNTEPKGIVEAFSDGTATIFDGVEEWSISQNGTGVRQSANKSLPLSIKLPVYRWLQNVWQKQ